MPSFKRDVTVAAILAQGYPSIGDVHSTIPVPKEQWFEYGGERSGRFQARACTSALPSSKTAANTLT